MKKVTVVIFPDGVRKVKQIKIPKIFFRLFLYFCVLAAGLLTWSFADYYTLKTQLPHRTQLLKENKQQRTQLAALADKIDKINTKVIESIEFDNKLKIIAGLEPDENNTQFLGIGGPDPSLMDTEYTVENGLKKMLRLYHQSLDNIDTAISVETLEKTDLYEFLENQKSMLSCTPSLWPAKGWVNNGYGWRKSPFTGEREFHKGLDIAAREGSPVIAPADGYVSVTVTNDFSFGNYVTISHGYGYKTRYGHLSKILVKKGQTVKRGDKIGLVGNTGRSTGSHLHYEVMVEEVQVNPKRYIIN